ncbi:fungal chitosanase of glycosyl hydrolase group 75-domain-containing protein, partial [Podospora australis]
MERMSSWLLLGMLFTATGVRADTAEEASAYMVPQNIQDFYQELRGRTETVCQNVLADGFYSTDTGANTTSYCTNNPHKPSILFLAGKAGALSNMDIDCDGVQGGPSDDGRCSIEKSPDYQSATAFRDELRRYNVPGVSDLNPYIHPYVVFGNSAEDPAKKKNWKVFDPQKYGVRPLSVMAVVCPSDNNKRGERKLVYGIWGDTNGDDGTKPMVGEVSISLATACRGKNMTGYRGYDGDDVLYIAFAGKEAVPGPKGADWAAKDYEAFERSIRPLGDKLVVKMK